MGFSTKRGRPKTVLPQKDLGTTELQKKRAQNSTIEPLDLLLERSLINQSQHWAGVHLRWLFTIKMGAPNISAIDLQKFAGKNIRSEDNGWRNQREAEYDLAVAALRQARALSAVMDLAVYGVVHLPLKLENLQKTRDGLSLLCKLWRRKA